MIYYVDQANSAASDENAGRNDAPFLTIQAAVDIAGPGDTIYVKSGTYDSVRISTSGTEDAPITLRVHPDHVDRVVVDGGGAQLNKPYGAIHVDGASHVVIDGFEVTNSHFGIAACGIGDGKVRDVIITNNYVHDVDNSGIWVSGQLMHLDTTVDEFTVFDIIISDNEVTRTNIGRVSGGANEAISIAGGVDGFVVTRNWIHDTKQYGIDAKTNVKNGFISDNVIHGIEKYGIYIDSNSRTASNIEISRNVIFDAENGIVLAREANDGLKPHLKTNFGASIDDFHYGEYVPILTNITIKDNVVAYSEKSGIYIDMHHTMDLGGGRYSNILIEGNTVAESGINALHIDRNLEGTLTDVVVKNNILSNSGARDINTFQSGEITMTENSHGKVEVNAVGPVDK